MSVENVKLPPWLKITVPLLVRPPLRLAIPSPLPSWSVASFATSVLPALETVPARVRLPLFTCSESPAPMMSTLPVSVQSSPFILTEAKPSPSFSPIKLLSSVPVPTRVRVLPVERVEMTSPDRFEPVLRVRVLYLLLANIIAVLPPPIEPLLMMSAFAVSVTLIPF